MSLVGTRPILQDELQKYELHHRARIAIKPGITGMWQVSGRSDITDFEEVVRLDGAFISMRQWTIFGNIPKRLSKHILDIAEIILELAGNIRKQFLQLMEYIERCLSLVDIRLDMCWQLRKD